MADLSTATLEDLRGPVVGETPVLKSVPLPGGARVAVTVQLAFEAWKGTRVSGNALGSPLGEEARALGVPDYATISSQEYGGQTGIWRILDVLDELGIKAACSTSTLVAEVWPDAVRRPRLRAMRSSATVTARTGPCRTWTHRRTSRSSRAR